MLTIGFARDRSFKSKLIRFATGGVWSHCWIEYPSEIWGGRWIAHASADGIIKIPAEQYLKSRDTYIRYEVLKDIRQGLVKSRNHVGKKYDFFAAIFNGLLLLLFRLTGIQLWEPVINHNRITCSEFVATILKAGGIPEMQDKIPELMTPSMLEEICNSSKDFRRIENEGKSRVCQ